MKSAVLTTALALATAGAPPRISLDLSEARAMGVAVTDHHVSAELASRPLGYDGSAPASTTATAPVLSRQDWTQRCPAGSSTETTCPKPKASAYDHNNGVLDVVESIYRINVNGVDEYTAVSDISYANRASYLIKFDAQDHSGNHAEQIVFALILDDTTNPSISLCMPATQTVQANTNWNICTSTFATDNIDSQSATTGTLRFTIQDRSDSTGTFMAENVPQANIANVITTLQTGEFLITATAHDFAGVYGKPDPSSLIGGNNVDVTSAIVTVVDTTAPVITVAGTDPAQSECGSTYSDAGATASDSLDNALSPPLNIPVTPTNNVDNNNVGDYWYKYNAQDSHGNAAEEKQRTVQIRDTTAPTVTYATGSNALIIHRVQTDADKAASSLNDPGVVCSDTCDTSTIVPTTSWGSTPFNPRVVGTYSRTYFCQDAHNNVGEITREIQVVDEHSPVIAIHGLNPITVEADLTKPYSDAGASCTDWHEGPLSVATTIDFNGAGSSLATPGTYQVSYSCTDSATNAALVVARTVVVEDTTCPQVTRLGKQTVEIEAGFPYVDAGATAWDNIDGTITPTTNGGVTEVAGKAQPGTYKISYTVTDAHNNAQCATVWRTVTVSDTLPPIIVMRLNGKKIAVGDYSQTGIGGVHNNAAAGQIAEDSNPDFMAEVQTSSVNGWIVGAVASGVTGLALLAYGSR